MEVHRNLDTNLKFVCKICNAQYGRSFALNEHIKSAHDGMPNEAVEDTEEHYVIESDTQSVVEEEDNKEVYSVVMVAKK